MGIAFSITGGFRTVGWHDLFQGVMGAAATLAGLLFVAISLNHEEIISHARLPALAARSLAMLASLVMLSAFVLAPDQSRTVVGAEIFVLGLCLTVGVVVSCLRGFAEIERTAWKVQDLGGCVLATVPMAAAGVSVLLGAGGGLYWAMAEAVGVFAAVLYNAWVLLVEIRR